MSSIHAKTTDHYHLMAVNVFTTWGLLFAE